MTVVSFDQKDRNRHEVSMTISRLALSILCISLSVTTAQSQDAPPTMGPETCLPVESLKESLSQFDGLKPDRLDTVRAGLTLSMPPKETEADMPLTQPDRVEVREGDTILPLTLDPDRHQIVLTDIVPTLSETAQLCIVDTDLDGLPATERPYSVDFGLGVRFLETPGTHTMDELEDGLKDGRSHYKKMAGAMGFMVPKFGHMAVAGDDPENPPRLWGTREGQDLTEPDFVLINGGRLVSFKDLEKMGADGIRIEGDYRLSPSPDAKTVEKFMK